jgi:hypothetical protein
LPHTTDFRLFSEAAIDKTAQAASNPPEDTQALAKMLAPSEKEALRQVIREELDDGSKKQTNILMNLFGNRIIHEHRAATRVPSVKRGFRGVSFNRLSKSANRRSPRQPA